MSRKKSSPLKPGDVVDYKDVRKLQRFLTEQGFRVTAAGEQALAEDRKALAELAREILDGR